MKLISALRFLTNLAFAILLAFSFVRPAQAATVLRTNVFHQITALLSDPTVFSGAVDAYSNPQGMRLSADGKKVVFVRPGRGGTNYLYTINYDGSGMNLIDTFTDGSTLVDISADGSKVVRFGGVSGVIQTLNSDGSNPHQVVINGGFVSCHLTADGSKVFFAVDRGFAVSPSSTILEPGIYVINSDGTGFRPVIAATAIAANVGVTIGQLIPNGVLGYWNTSNPRFWQISDDGSKVVFFLNATIVWSVVGMNTDGTGWHNYAFPDYPPTGYFGFYSVGISGDGSKVFYYLKEADSSEELAVYNWDGTGRRVVYSHPYGQGATAGFSLVTFSHDGSKLMFGDTGYLFNTDGSGILSLDYFNISGTLPSGTEGNPLTGVNMNSNATQFAFLNYSGTARYLYQVVTLTLNPTSLGAAPALSNPYATPTYWIHNTDYTPVSVVVTPTNGVSRVATTSLRNGVKDGMLSISLQDDGTHGDVTAGDGIYFDGPGGYRGNFLYLYNPAADQGPRSMRFIAESTAADGLVHVTTIDAAPFFFLLAAPTGPAPVITSINPPSATAGTQATITGTGFDPVATNNFVLFGNQVVIVVSAAVDGTQLVVQLPVDIQPVTLPVIVGALGQVSNPFSYTITDPLAATLTLQLLAGLQISGAINNNYRIDYLTDVRNPNSWSTLTNLNLPTNPYFWVDLSSTNQPRRYYRAVRVP